MGFPIRSGLFAIVRDIYFNINRTFSANTILQISHLSGFAFCEPSQPNPGEGGTITKRREWPRRSANFTQRAESDIRAGPGRLVKNYVG
jgi:hypothetical protein